MKFGKDAKTEIRTINIEAYRDNDGRPTCKVGGKESPKCRFLCQTIHHDRCSYTMALLFTDKHGLGHIRPVEGCPVWTEKA